MCALSGSGTALAWGRARFFDMDDYQEVPAPRPIFPDQTARAVSCTQDDATALVSDVVLLRWEHRQAFIASAPVVAMAGGCVIESPAALRCWPGRMSLVDLDGPARLIGTGDVSRCVVIDANRLRCWGDNEYGQLGGGTAEAAETPTPVVGFE
ncbi:Hypothetical protein I5071_57600 [Sandaracinus amylolyticus]|nr:Hypothetical protein I5071_57600 [Sandaracinus amylolyticus]